VEYIEVFSNTEEDSPGLLVNNPEAARPLLLELKMYIVQCGVTI